MTQTKFVKIVCATVVLAVQLLWNRVKLVLLAAATILRAVSSGPGSSEAGASSETLATVILQVANTGIQAHGTICRIWILVGIDKGALRPLFSFKALHFIRGINRIRSRSSRTACTLDRVQRRLVQY